MYQDQAPDDSNPWTKRLEELLRESRQADKEDLAKADAFQVLVKHASWVPYLALLNTRIQHLADALLAPAGSINGMVTQEYLKGAMSGLILARDLPSVIIAATAEIRKPATEEA